MLNAKRVFKDTPAHWRKSSQTDVIKLLYSVQPKKDAIFGRPYAAVYASVRRNPPKGSGCLRKVELRMYDAQSMDSDIWATCSCESWCLHSTTLLYTTTKRAPIKDFCDTTQEICNKDNQPRQVSVFSTGEALTYLLTVENGKQLRATPNEKLWVRDPQEGETWRRLDALVAGDHVAMKEGTEITWQKVVSVGEPLVVETYDAYEEQDHHFIANGFVVHNTYRAEITWSTKGSSSVIYTKDHPTLPYIRNPHGLVWACPHVLHILGYALFDRRVKEAIEAAKQLEKPTKEDPLPKAAPKCKKKKKKKATSKKKAAPKNKSTRTKKKAGRGKKR